MSTKIFGGMRSLTMSPFDVLDGVRRVVDPLWHARFAASMARLEEHVGKPWSEAEKGILWSGKRYAEFGAKTVAESVWTRADDLFELIQLLDTDPTHTFSDLDFNYKVGVLPNGLGREHTPLVLLFSERAGHEYREALAEAGVVEEYGYWNNVDRPDDITKAEWKVREKAWDLLDVPHGEGLWIEPPARFDAWITYTNTLKEQTA